MNKLLNATITTIRTTGTTAIDWISNHIANLWNLHTEALRTRSSYRAEIVTLVIAVVGLLSIQAPLDVVIAAAISAYVAYYGSHSGGPGFVFDSFV